MSSPQASSANEGLDGLLSDAKLLAMYGQRAGKLRSSGLFEAIAAFDGLQPKTWNAAETVALQKAINLAAIEILPTTLMDIRRQDPFGRAPPGVLKRSLLITFSILLMAITAYLTVLYNRGSELIVLLETIDKSKPAEKMAAIARERNAAKFSDDSSLSETYYKMLDELRDLDRSVQTYITESGAYTTAIHKINPFVIFPRAFWRDDPVQMLEGKTEGKDPCSQQAGQPGQTSEFLQKPPGLILDQNKKLILNFRCAEGLVISPYSTPLLTTLGGEVRRVLVILGFWLLPGLYGALGATVFYMRAILNPLIPDPPMEQIVHRIALGGFAGIIFAWFWAPSFDTSDAFAGLTINSFALAFIIGFSIDVFFALLDKFVGFLQRMVHETAYPATSNAIAFPGGVVATSERGTQGNSGANRSQLVIRSIAPQSIKRSPIATTLIIVGDNLGVVRSVKMSTGSTEIAGSGVTLTASGVTCDLMVDEKAPAGVWKVHLIDGSGQDVIAPQSITVT